MVAVNVLLKVMRGLYKLLYSVIHDAEAISHFQTSVGKAALTTAGFSSAPTAAGQCIRAAEASLPHAAAASAGVGSTSSALRTVGAASTSGRVSAAEVFQLYKQLSKHRLSALVVSTAAAGFVAGAPHVSA